MDSNEIADPLATYVSDFSNRRVLVLGDVILDEYLMGDCSRISPEAPVPVVRIRSVRQVLGGAANTAANVASLGGQATLIGFVGGDESGDAVRRCASAAGVNLIAVDAGPTLRKTRVVGQQHQIVRLDYEEMPTSRGSHETTALASFDARLDQCDIVVISDYAKGFLSLAGARAIIDRAHAMNRQVIVDPRPQNRHFYAGCDYLTPNWRESRALLGLPEAEASEEDVRSVAASLAAGLGANIVLTLGPQGISFCSRDGREQFAMPTLAREVFDVSGAGDTVVATLALALATGANHEAALALANRAASVVVGKFGTATVAREEILQGTNAVRLVPRRGLAQLAATLRAKGKRIVTINGSFDLLHGGHLHILSEASKQGDVLIVGVNSDASVRSYKGPGRPVVPEERRAEMLLALRVVDYVHIFAEPDPIAFLGEVAPDVHINGSEYGEHCLERESVQRGGGKLHLVDRLPGLSTSQILADMRHACENSRLE